MREIEEWYQAGGNLQQTSEVADGVADLQNNSDNGDDADARKPIDTPEKMPRNSNAPGAIKIAKGAAAAIRSIARKQDVSGINGPTKNNAQYVHNRPETTEEKDHIRDDRRQVHGLRSITQKEKEAIF